MKSETYRPSSVAGNTRLNGDEIRNRSIFLKSRPTRFHIDLTGVCNINPPCVFCYLRQDGYRYGHNDINALKACYDFFRDCERVTDDSFGEPLSHPHFLEAVKMIVRGGRTFGFSTNGLLLLRPMIHSIIPYARNIYMHVSMNASNSLTYKNLTGKSFDILIDNISTYISVFKEVYGSVNPSIESSFIVMRANAHEVIDYIKLNHALGVKKVNLRHLFAPPVYLDRADDSGSPFAYSNQVVSNLEYGTIAKDARKLAMDLNMDLAVHWEVSSSIIGRLAEKDVDIPCLLPWKFLSFQEHTKRAYVCCYSDSSVGSTDHLSLDQIWNDSELLKMREALVKGSLPEFCLMHGTACPLVNSARQADGALREKKIYDNYILMGENDLLHCEEGWYEREHWPPTIRWTKQQATARLRVGDERHIYLEISTSYPLLSGQNAKGHLDIDDTTVGFFEIDNGEWGVLSFELPLAVQQQCIKIGLVTHTPWCASRFTDSGDRRKLGVAVAKIWLD